MITTSTDPQNNNGRSLRIVSTNQLFTKVRTEQRSGTVLPSIMDTANLFSNSHQLDVFRKDELTLNERISTSFAPLQHDHSYGISANSSTPDFNIQHSDSNSSSVVRICPQLHYRTSRSDDYPMLLELLSSNTNVDSSPILFGSALIDPLTSTPYSDATRAQPKKRLRPGHIKRPMNAFMVFSQIERRKIVQLAPHLPNSDISKCCGAKWKRMSLRERQPYMEESERLKHLHARQYPTYKYQPRKRSKTNPSTNVTAYSLPVVASSSSSPPSNTMTIPSHALTSTKEQAHTPPPLLAQPSSSTSSNPNDPISLLVAKLFDHKLAMFANNFQQFNIDHLQYHFTPPNTTLYPIPTPLPFDPVAFLAKQQNHRIIE